MCNIQMWSKSAIIFSDEKEIILTYLGKKWHGWKESHPVHLPLLYKIFKVSNPTL